MAAGVAHNFKNILGTILGYTQLFQDEPEDEAEVHESLTMIEKAARDATQMVQRIETFGRGTSTADFVSTDLPQLVQEMVDVTRPIWKDQAQQRGKLIEVTLQLEAVPLVYSRAAEIREVVTNLMINAVDAMPQGGRITLSTYQSEHYACIAVSDTGTGMPKEVQRRIFDRFFSTKGNKGTGLGLSVSHTLLKGHGGDIEVESTPGNGTTFVVTLPIA